MKFKTKLRRIGNSQGVYIPKDVITSYNIGDVITLSLEDSNYKEDNVITEKPMTSWPKVGDKMPVDKAMPSSYPGGSLNPPPRKRFNTKWCKKHDVFMGSCGCK